MLSSLCQSEILVRRGSEAWPYRARLEIGFSGYNPGTWVRIPPPPPYFSSRLLIFRLLPTFRFVLLFIRNVYRQRASPLQRNLFAYGPVDPVDKVASLISTLLALELIIDYLCRHFERNRSPAQRATVNEYRRGAIDTHCGTLANVGADDISVFPGL